MQRPRSPTLAASIECDSSPDPLADSVNSHNITRSDGRSNRRLTSPRKTPLREISGNPKMPSFGSPTHSLLPSNSPMKAITEQTLSPWKIRVTVEAEPENGRGQAQTSTRTYQIPLKPCSSPLEAAASRGRVKKAAQSSPARRKRSATPVRAGRPRKSVTDLNITVLGDEEVENEWSPKKKTSKRKSRQSSPAKRLPHREASVNGIQETKDMYSAPDEHSASDVHTEDLRELDLNRVSVRTRSTSIRHRDIQHPASDHLEQRPGNEKASKKPSRNFSNHSTRSYPTPSPTPSAPGDHNIDDDDMLTYADGHEGYDTVLESEGFTMIDLDSIPSATQSYSSPADNILANRQGPGAPQGRLSSQPPASRKIGPTMSENSIHDDAPDLQVDAASDSGSEGEEGARSRTRGSAAYEGDVRQPKEFISNNGDETELSSNVASSPPIASSFLEVPNRANILRKVTPEVYSSPKLPSPPKQHRKEESPTDNVVPPKRVVNAGRALQGAVSSPSSATHEDLQEASTPVQGDFLDGFSSGTKRELRAGLRFGEELAKRQISAIPSEKQQPHERPRHATQIWRGEAIVRHSPLATDVSAQTKNNLGPDGRTILETNKSPLSQVQSMDGLHTRKASTVPTPESQRCKSSPAREYPTLDRRQVQREHEWKMEREAVSRQINEATPSKVILIDSSSIEESLESEGSHGADEVQDIPRGPQDHTIRHEVPTENRIPQDNWTQGRQAINEGAAVSGKGEAIPRLHESPRSPRCTVQGGNSDSESQDCQNGDGTEDQDQTDLWLEQAQLSSSSPQSAIAESRDPDRPLHEQGQAAELVAKSRRSVIPSPWKRGENIEDSTVLTIGDASGMIWQQPIGTKFGATALARQTRRVTSGNFDVDRMVTSPTKMAFPGRKNMRLRQPDEASSSAEPSFCDDVTGATHTTDLGSPIAQSSTSSSPPQPVKVPVNFNDSVMITPPSIGLSQAEEGNTRAHPANTSTREKMSSRRSSRPEAIMVPANNNPIANSFNGETPAITSSKVRKNGHESRSEQPEETCIEINVPVVATPIEITVPHVITPPSTRSSHGADDDVVEPPTPRSALRGGRISAGLEEPGMSPTKRVVFNERSRYLNERGDESTMSANFDSPAPTPVDEASPQLEQQQELDEELTPDSQPESKAIGWVSWLMRGKKQSSPTGQVEATSSKPGPDSPGAEATQHKSTTQPKVQPRITTNPFPTAGDGSRTLENGPHKTLLPNALPTPPSPTSIRPPKPPSYLLPPSYPTIPTRTTSTRLLPFGDFTNAHFRTLHILHAKSRYTSFHIPKHIRRSIQELRGYKVTIDESRSGYDEFEWQVGFTECAVLERFCQEVEWDILCHDWRQGGRDLVLDLQDDAVEAAIRRERGKGGDAGRAVEMLRHMSRDEIRGYWEGLEREGRDVWTREMRKADWGWSVQQLAEWLGRVVIGEVVRRDEKIRLGEASVKDESVKNESVEG